MTEALEVVRDYSYASVPTIKRFSQSRAFIRGLMGPFGSGKSSGRVIELVKLALGQLDLGKAAAMSLVYMLIIIIVCWVFFTVMTNTGRERRAGGGE